MKPKNRSITRYIIRRSFFFLITGSIIGFCACLPAVFLNDSTSTVLLDQSGYLLGAKISDDGQWRFQQELSVPSKFETCLLQFEDKNFRSHIGLSASGIARAVKQNFTSGKIVSGGSTITMQLARIINRNPSRTYSEKIVEMAMALRLEIRYSKDDILKMYCSHAPFGNNVVGLSAASWRYFGRSPEHLSWSECAVLAVLPNAPGLIYPGKNHERLKSKRDRLLKKLLDNGFIKKEEFDLAIEEPLPDKPLPLPQIAPHLLNRCMEEGFKGKTVKSTLSIAVQQRVSSILSNHLNYLGYNQIHNGAILISSVKTGEVIAYVGNALPHENSEYSEHVDCVNSPRSTGSVLKPVLYEKSLEEGLINPNALLEDVPTFYGGFSPKNFNQSFDGCVRANDALCRSLNVPFVKLLNEYGYEKFYFDLKKLGISTLNQPSSHYGLSIILGGAEAKLWDINHLYLSMAGQLAGIDSNGIHYTGEKKQGHGQKLDHASLFATFDAMTELNRPDEEGNWKTFERSRKIAWKTGTSFGFRDAWAVGVTSDYVVSVWIGNADGEGRAGLTGIKAAAPVMFDVFKVLKANSGFFKKPLSGFRKSSICAVTGYTASLACTNTAIADVPESCLKSKICPYHQFIMLDEKEQKRVNANCYDAFKMKKVSMLVFTPIVDRYYRLNHPEYNGMPDWFPGCQQKESESPLNIVYPRNKAVLYVPIEISGTKGKIVFEAAHRKNNQKVFWQLDEKNIGITNGIHQLQYAPDPGKHTLSVLDETGNISTIEFEISERIR